MCQSAYVHIPFCEQICAYCDFFRCGYNSFLAKQWLDVMLNEIDTLKLSNLKTLYIGGGTPTSLENPMMEILLSKLKPSLSNGVEYTMEANVSHLNDEKLSLITRYGVNRISLGIQSFQDALLEQIGRTHRQKDILPCLERIHRHGIHNISIDLI